MEVQSLTAGLASGAIGRGECYRERMARVDDVVAFVLEQSGTMTTYKLQKLLYYAQGWSLAWDDRPLFDAKIKAYDKGPCVGTVFNDHRGQRHVSRWSQGDSSQLTEDDRDTVRAVLEMYGRKTSDELVTMTHEEAPWLASRAAKERGGRDEITTEALRAFFLRREDAKTPTPAAHAMAHRLASFLADDGRDDTRR